MLSASSSSELDSCSNDDELQAHLKAKRAEKFAAKKPKKVVWHLLLKRRLILQKVRSPLMNI